MKNKILVLCLIISLLTAFIACNEQNGPIITTASEFSSTAEVPQTEPEADNSAETKPQESSSETTVTETGSAPASETEASTAAETVTETVTETETESAPCTETEVSTAAETVTETEATSATETQTVGEFQFINITFNNVRDMINSVKRGIDISKYGYTSGDWMKVDYDRIYELSNLPSGYYDNLVEWSGKNSYMIYYHNDKANMETREYTDICFEPLGSKEELEEYMYSGWLFGEENFKRFSNIRTTEENTEYGVMVTTIYNTNTMKNLKYERLDSYDSEGNLAFVYARKNSGRFSFLFMFDSEIPYAIIHLGSLTVEEMLSFVPVRVK